MVRESGDGRGVGSVPSRFHERTELRYGDLVPADVEGGKLHRRSAPGVQPMLVVESEGIETRVAPHEERTGGDLHEPQEFLGRQEPCVGAEPRKITGARHRRQGRLV